MTEPWLVIPVWLWWVLLVAQLVIVLLWGINAWLRRDVKRLLGERLEQVEREKRHVAKKS
ncbi:MAG: hypothetical protein AAFW82_07645 [Pseudomonadota bacterium]